MSECPWAWLSPSAASFCEESLCGWIRQPGNTWSNVGFIVVGLLLLRETADPAKAHLRALGWITLVTGIGSAFFHATETRIGGVLDYAGIFLGSAFMLVVCFRRWTSSGLGPARIVFWGLFGTSMLSLSRPELPRYATLALSAACLISEIGLYLSPTRRARSYYWWWISWIFFGGAMAFWITDLEGTLCAPTNHWISGHAAWHLLNAVGFWTTYRYFLQFDVLRKR